MKRRGQGLSITTIIVAAIALIVLVVLIAVFTGQIGKFTGGIGEEARTELATLKLTYGECHPTANEENTFLSEYDKATDANAKAAAKTKFQKVIADCKALAANKCTDKCTTS